MRGLFQSVAKGRCRSTPTWWLGPKPANGTPRMPERLYEEELADWRAGRNAIYQLAALTIGTRLAVADA